MNKEDNVKIVHDNFNELIELARRALLLGRFISLRELCIQDITVIAHTARNPLLTAKKLSQCLQLPKTTIVSAVSRLVKRGYLRRVKNKQDKRESLLALTQKGEQAYKVHLEYEHYIVQAYLEKWNEEEQESLLGLLKKRRKENAEHSICKEE